jgi:hypothetical protein
MWVCQNAWHTHFFVGGIIKGTQGAELGDAGNALKFIIPSAIGGTVRRKLSVLLPLKHWLYIVKRASMLKAHSLFFSYFPYSGFLE